MTNLEKTLAGLEFARTFFKARADMVTPGSDGHLLLLGSMKACANAAELLKAQEPRVMTLSGARNLKESTPVWLEDVDKKDLIGALFMQDYSGTKCVDFAIVRDWEFERVVADYMDYGVRWRCWTARPTDEQRKATPWCQHDQRDYEAAIEMAEYCEHYEPTYNAEDGSM